MLATGLNSPPLEGVWDQVLAFGQYQHVTVNGEPVVTVFDASTCKAMLDDFAAHPESDVFIDKQHEIVDELGDDALDREKLDAWGAGDGHAMGWANALCMIVAGQVVRYEPHAGAPAKPTAESVLRQSDGSLRGDGVYAFRASVTPRGADPKDGLASFRNTSPYFVPEKDGYRLLNYTATNDPRMRGAALAYSRQGRIAMQRVEMGARTDREIVRSKYPGASVSRVAPNGMGLYPAQSTYTLYVPGAGAVVANVLTEDEAWSHMADRIRREAGQMENRMDKELMARAGCMESDTSDQKLEKMIAYASKMEEDARKKDEESAMARKKMEDEVASMKRAMESHKEPDGDEGKAAMQSMQRQVAVLTEKLSGVTKELADTRTRIANSDALVARTRKADAETFAKSAIAMGRVRGDHKGDVAKTEAWLSEKYLKDATEAEDVLMPEGTFQPSEPRAMSRLGLKTEREEAEGESLDAKTDRAIAQEVVALRKELGKEPTTAQAMSRAKAKNPDLFKQWEGRSGGRLAS